MKGYFYWFPFLLIVCALKAQQGAPLLTNFKESIEIENPSWAICQDDNNVMLFANRREVFSLLMVRAGHPIPHTYNSLFT